MRILNDNGCTFHEAVPKQEVEAIQKNADVVVFAESLEKAHKYAARLSFSTKLTDYFKSGKCIFAIGDKAIAPIEYLKENDAAVIATDYKEIEEELKALIESPETIKRYGRNAFECGRRNHEESKVKKTFRDTFIRAANHGNKA